MSVVWLDEDSVWGVACDLVELDLLSQIRIIDLYEFLLSHLHCFNEGKLMVAADEYFR